MATGDPVCPNCGLYLAGHRRPCARHEIEAQFPGGWWDGGRYIYPVPTWRERLFGFDDDVFRSDVPRPVVDLVDLSTIEDMKEPRPVLLRTDWRVVL